LEHRAEYRWGNCAPVELEACEQQISGVYVKGGYRENLAKKASVDVWKGPEVFIHRIRALSRGYIQDLEYVGKQRPDISAIGARFLRYLKVKLIAGLENSGVVSEETIDDANQKDLERVTAKTCVI
jgi:hypothetical protein